MTITQHCRLSEEVKTGDLLEVVFLDRAIKEKDSKEADRDFVLRATFPTAPLRALVEHVAQKLKGEQRKGFVVVRGDLGSGKSHALLALYHVILSGRDAHPWLSKWKIKGTVPSSARVVLAQLASEVPETLWELLFERAELPDLAALKRTPKREEWAHVAQDQPTLLIIDELEGWFNQLDGTPREQTKVALQNLFEAANLENVPLAVAVSIYGRNPALMEFVNRTQPPILDVGTAEDRKKIVRHRLVEADSIDESKVKELAKGYTEAYQRIGGELPRATAHLADVQKDIVEAFPFHPAFLDRVFQVYSAASHHELTRGVIFLCATLLREFAAQRDLMLTGDVDILNEQLAQDLRKLDADLVASAQSDLTDQCREIKAARGVIGAILLPSFLPLGHAGATREDILLGNYRPAMNVNDLQGDVEQVISQSWHIDEDKEQERYFVAKEIVLSKQIEQQARAMIDSPEGRQKAAERIRETLCEFLQGEAVALIPEDAFPEALAGGGLRYAVSLEPLKESDAEGMLQAKGNTIVLIAPKPIVRERITQDREILLRAARALVCEALLSQRTKRQSDVRTYKQRHDRDLREKLEQSYGRWMRLSRTNELGEPPAFVMRAVDCALSADAIRSAIGRENDIDVIRGGVAKVLRYAGRGAAKGSDQAGRTIREIREELRRQAGLPILLNETQLPEALRGLARESHPNTGVVVSVGRALYGYDQRPLPDQLPDDSRVWLKLFAPEPPAPEDVRQATRQILAEAARLGKNVAQIKNEMASRLRAQVERQDVLRALAELVNEHEAVLEQETARFPDDGDLASDAIRDHANVWLKTYAPPDARHARTRLHELLRVAAPNGLTLGELKKRLNLEGIGDDALHRALGDLVQSHAAVRLENGQPVTEMFDVHLLSDELVFALREGIAAPPPPTPVGVPYLVSVGPYRLLDQFTRDLAARLPDDVRVHGVTFRITPTEDSPDPLFGIDKEIKAIAQISAQHSLVCNFTPPVSKAAVENLAQRLVEHLQRVGAVLLSADVQGEVMRRGY